jgi:Domain of unknown function (DUF5655)
MAGHECYHCKQWVGEGEPHDCWSTTEAALTRHLSDDLREAWERLRETAAAFGEQRIYASHHSIMFSLKTCYFFVRPKQKYLELCVFLGRRLEAPQVRRVDQASKSKLYHLIRVVHRDEVEPPITDWLQEAYMLSTNSQSRVSRNRLPRESRQRHGNPKALRGNKDLKLWWRANMPCFGLRFPLCLTTTGGKYGDQRFSRIT